MYKKPEYQSKRTYPEVLIPQQIQDILAKHPEYPRMPIKPGERYRYVGFHVYTESTVVQKPEVPSQQKVSFGDDFVVYLFIFLVPFLIIAAMCGANYEVFITGSTICVALAIYMFIYSFNSKKKAYQEAINSYPKRIEEYKLALKKHEQEMKKYNIEYEEYEKEMTRLSSQEYLSLFRRNLFFSQLQNSMKPLIADIKNVNKGVSESYFFSTLKKKFGDDVYEKLCLNGSRTLFPDMLYWDKSINLIIDIEIDEPYVGYSGEPIHYLQKQDDWDYNGNRIYDSIDEWRDVEVNNANWFVIRFAEQQIFQNPEGCIKYIDYVIDGIKKLDFNFTQQVFLSPIKRWTKEEAHKMAYQRFRLSYVPPAFHDLLKVENNYEDLLEDVEDEEEPELL
jgi:hypothetical protein